MAVICADTLHSGNEYYSEPDSNGQCCHLEDLAKQVLCAERVTQMTQTYNDIEAVNSLLQEKERDLELAARIGQSLLERNKELENKTSEYEVQLTEANDKIRQLRHDVSQKEALLQVYFHDEELSPTTPEDERLQLRVGVLNTSGLQKKIQTLETENFNLVKQTASLQTETTLLEEKEQSLFRDCFRQLEGNKDHVLRLQEELLSKSDFNLHQQEEITSLTARNVALEAQNKQLTGDNNEATKNLETAYDVQRKLTVEIGELEERNEELELLLRECQEEMKSLKKKQKPGFIRHHASYNSPFLPEGSLALELEDSLRKDVDCPPGYTPNDRRQHSKHVMRTARAVRRASRKNVRSPTDSINGNESLMSSSYHSSLYVSEGELSEGGYGTDIDCSQGSNLTLGRPGLSGSNDLETALKRLTMKRAHESHERLDRQKDPNNSDCLDMTPPCRTPDSMMSLGSYSNLSDFSRVSGNSAYRIPEKLQIVKPMEGSQTLHHWKRLATPHLANVLEHRPGIQNKGDVHIDSEQEEAYSLSDYEEDDDYSLHLGKCMEQTCGIYTFTTAKVLHPNDEFNNSINRLEGLNVSPPVMTMSNTAPVSSPGVSYCKLNDYGTSTFSMSAGLAQGLAERGSLTQSKSTSSTRYGNIVTETISGGTQSQTEVLYTTAGGVSTVSPSKGSTATAALLNVNADNAYLALADKVKDIGLNTILGIAKKSGITPVQLDPVDAGLNAIMSIKRNRGAINRGMAEKASQTIVYAKTPRYKRELLQPTVGHMDVQNVKTTHMLVTNSTRIIMAAPMPSSSAQTFIPGLSSTPKAVKSPDDMELLRTLPSVTVKTSVQQKSVVRPNSLSLIKVDDIHPCDRYSMSSGSVYVGSTHQAVPGCEPGPSVSVPGDGLSSGLLKHLSSIYTKTRDVIGAPAAALGSSLYKNN